MRCSINPEKCEFASNMKDRPMSRCLKYDDAILCSKCQKDKKNKSKKAKLRDIKEKINNYDFTNKKVQQYLKRKEENNK